jgi:hypothetical protein
VVDAGVGDDDGFASRHERAILLRL